MTKKMMGMLLAALLVFVTACSSGNGNKVANTPGNEGNATPEQETIHIAWWDYQNNPIMVEAIEKQLSDYMAANPNVVIERTFVPFADIKSKLLLGSAAGQLPDIVAIDGPDFQSIAASGILADLTSEVEAWGQVDQYFEAPWSSTMYDGKNFGVPATNNNLALFYNADMLEAANVEPPTTWDELQEAALKLSGNGVYGMAVSGVRSEQSSVQFLPFLWQSGADLTNLEHPGTVKTLQLMKTMIDNGSMSKDILTQDQTAGFMQFLAGNYAMIESGSFFLPLIRQDETFNWGVVPLPSDAEKATILGGDNWGITSTTKHKDVAWDILRFGQEPENLLPILIAGGRLPARKDLIIDPYIQNDPEMKVFADQHSLAKARAYGPEYPKMSEVLQEMIQQTLTGVKTPEEAAQEAVEKMKPLLQN